MRIQVKKNSEPEIKKIYVYLKLKKEKVPPFSLSFKQKKMKTPTILLALVANLALTQASFYGPKDDVKELTPQNFGAAILDTDVNDISIPYPHFSLY
jgi:hypothetical protein